VVCGEGAHRQGVVAGSETERRDCCPEHLQSRTKPEGTSLDGDWLKLCTFKVAPDFSGNKLGELLLKTAFSYCQQNRIPGVFVTAYPRHEALVGLFTEFGFQHIERLADDEVVLAKTFTTVSAGDFAGDPVGYNTLYYPHYLQGDLIKKFVVPVVPEYHQMLFPEWEPQQALFPSIDPVGNAIRKAYLCNATTNRLEPGDLIFFYRSHDAKAVTTIAVVEKTLRSSDPQQLAAFVGKRTVYTPSEIGQMSAGRSVLAIIFRQCRHLPQPVTFARLRSQGMLKNHVETITAISHEAALRLLREAGL
jgi:hypothetical protein